LGVIIALPANEGRALRRIELNRLGLARVVRNLLLRNRFGLIWGRRRGVVVALLGNFLEESLGLGLVSLLCCCRLIPLLLQLCTLFLPLFLLRLVLMTNVIKKVSVSTRFVS
jgi:hypothetical protein